MLYRWLCIAYLAGHLAVQVNAQVFWAYNAAIANNYCFTTNVGYVAYGVFHGNAFLIDRGVITIPAGGVAMWTEKGEADSFQGGAIELYGPGGPVIAGGNFWFSVGQCTQPSGGWSFTNSIGYVPYPVPQGPVLKPVFARRRLPGGGFTNAIVGFYRK